MIVSKGNIPAHIVLPTSKSFSNRVLILGAISHDWITIEGLSESSDVAAMVECLEKIGVHVQRTSIGKIKIKGSFPDCEPAGETLTLNVADGGTTSRFLLPLLAQGKREYQIIAKEKLAERPMSEVFNILSQYGVMLKHHEGKSFPLNLKGPIQWPEKLEVSAARSTQFATGLLLATANLPLALNVTHLQNSKPYWELSQQLVTQFKNGKRNFINPVDFSSLPYPAALGLFQQGVLFPQVREVDWGQADAKFLTFLQEMGGEWSLLPEGLRIFPLTKKLKAIKANCRDCPDLIPTLIFLASYAEGKSELYGVNILKHKESDRLREMLQILDVYKIKYEYIEEQDLLQVSGGEFGVTGYQLNPARDHRMVMVSYLFLKSNGGGELQNIDCVEKSFPHFFEVMGEKIV